MKTIEQYPALDVEFMNQEHGEFVQLVREIEQGLENGKSMLEPLSILVQHVKDHFAHEERAMQAAGFPPYPIHKQEHDRVIALFEQQLSYHRQAEDNQSVLVFIQQDVPAWFEQHLKTMDTMTARFLAMKGVLE